jgi:Bacterial RNA polymerase, alpha chain C terminal domain
MQDIATLQSEYRQYDRQKCFVAHSLGAEWAEDLKSACATILPKFSLDPWYAAEHFDPTQSLRDKVVELIANSRYGIYDISSWQDKRGNWHLPRNVFIELGIAIALNRPTLLLRHSSNKSLSLPDCLQGIETVDFTGDVTLKKTLEKRLPQWLDVPPDRDWLNRFCIFGDRTCSFREQHPCSQQWGQQTLHCHIADGLEKRHSDYCQSECDEIRGVFEEVLDRYSDLEFSYLDERSLRDGYQFLLCSHCQTVRSTPFAIYRISPTTSAEVFVAIGISIALEMLFAYKIPKILLVRQEQDLPSLLRGYEVVEVMSTNDIKNKLKGFLPKVMANVRTTAWRPRPLPFVEIKVSLENRLDAFPPKPEHEINEELLYQTPIEELQLSVRSYNSLKKGQINLVGELLEYSPDNLLEIKGVGFKSRDEINNALQERLGINWTQSLTQGNPRAKKYDSSPLENSDGHPSDDEEISFDDKEISPESQIPIEELQLSVRAYNCLKRAQINSVGDLLDYTQEDLMEVKNFGVKSVEEVIEALKDRLGIILPIDTAHRTLLHEQVELSAELKEEPRTYV